MTFEDEPMLDVMADRFLARKPYGALSQTPFLHRKFFKKRLLATMGQDLVMGISNNVIGDEAWGEESQDTERERRVLQSIYGILGQYNCVNPSQRSEYMAIVVGDFLDDLLGDLDELEYLGLQKECILEGLKVKKNRMGIASMLKKHTLFARPKKPNLNISEKLEAEGFDLALLETISDYLLGDARQRLIIRNRPQEGLCLKIFDRLDALDREIEEFVEWNNKVLDRLLNSIDREPDV